MATNDNKTTTTICAVGALRDGGAVEELMMIACYDIAAAVYDCARFVQRIAHCHRRHLFAIFGFFVEGEGGRNRYSYSVLTGK